MNLLRDAWIPVRSGGGTGMPVLLSYRQLLCEPGEWEVSLPRDDLELACVQLLICMTQIMFLPSGDHELRSRIANLLPSEKFEQGIDPCRDWFDLDHEMHPFMQTRGTVASKITPIQKLLIGLPEGSSHAFFNEPGEVANLSGAVAAIALFNQASNCPSFGGGFKGSLRGNAPITTLVSGNNLRETVWMNVITIERIQERLPGWTLDFTKDRPTWVEPIEEDADISWSEIGLIRGLFWQPARVELIKGTKNTVCDILDDQIMPTYIGFNKEKFRFLIDGVWPHPHGAMNPAKESVEESDEKSVEESDGMEAGPSGKGKRKGKGVQWQFSSFTSAAPAWTLLTEFVVGGGGVAKGNKEGSVPAAAVTQLSAMGDSELHLLVGGYRCKQASVLERRHELVSLAQGWSDDRSHLAKLVEIAMGAKKILYGQLYYASSGSSKGIRELPGVGVKLHKIGDKLFFSRTEALIYETFSNSETFHEWGESRRSYVQEIVTTTRDVFGEITDPYMKIPKLIPIIAKARKQLNIKLEKLKKEAA